VPAMALQLGRGSAGVGDVRSGVVTNAPRAGGAGSARGATVAAKEYGDQPSAVRAG